jgi:single-stranded DNA-binding protein
MNSCILMAEIIQEPELRYTSDNQTPIAEMLVQFPGLRAEEPPSTLKVVGWGNLAQEIQERYHQGDRVVIEGRLSMNTIDRPEGFKEKRAELTAQRIHVLGAETSFDLAATAPATASSPMPGSSPSPGARSSTPAASSKRLEEPASSVASKTTPKSTPLKPQSYSAPPNEPDYDDIPF